MSATGGSNRRSWPMPSTSPASRHRATDRSASALVRASGFSQKMCLPAATAAAICVGVQRMRRGQNHRLDRGIVQRIGIVGRQRDALVGAQLRARSPRSARPRAPPGCRRARHCRTASIFWPHQPMPTRAILTGSRHQRLSTRLGRGGSRRSSTDRPWRTDRCG